MKSLFSSDDVSINEYIYREEMSEQTTIRLSLMIYKHCKKGLVISTNQLVTSIARQFNNMAFHTILQY